MTTYEVVVPQTGFLWHGGLDSLSKNLKVNALLCSVDKDGARTNLGVILHQDIVFFTLQWAKSVNKDPKTEALKCFELIEQWLEDEDSVTRAELNRAANTAYVAGNAAYAAANVAYAAAYAARAAAAAVAYVAANVAYVAAKASQGQMIVDYYTSLRAK